MNQELETIEALCDADFQKVVVPLVPSFKYQLQLLTVEWAQQAYNVSEWQPRSWEEDEQE